MYNTLEKGTILRGSSYCYEIVKTLGQGTFGITYLASVRMTGPLGTIDTNIKVAIKEFFMRAFNGRSGTAVTTGSTSDLYDYYKHKFAREATNLSKMKHPNIVKVLELFRQNDTIYYSMEYIDGGSLDDYIGNKLRLSESEAIQAIIQIGKAISFMHSKGMLHLDLKPQNIMRKSDGNYILIDFGLSKQYDENGNPESKTEVGKGTQGYAPIEQAYYHDSNDFPVTMDVYALGGTLYKMLTGIKPPEASVILNDGFPYEEFERYGISADLKECVANAMAPRKKDRYQTVQEFINAIETKNMDIAEVDYNNSVRNKDQKFPHVFYIQPDTSMVEIVHIPGYFSNNEEFFEARVTFNAVSVNCKSTSEHTPLTREQYISFLEELQALKLKIRKYANEEEYSEEPNKLIIRLYDKDGFIYNEFSIDEWHGGNIDDNGSEGYFSYFKKRIIQIIPGNSLFLNNINEIRIIYNNGLKFMYKVKINFEFVYLFMILNDSGESIPLTIKYKISESIFRDFYHKTLDYLTLKNEIVFPEESSSEPPCFRIGFFENQNNLIKRFYVTGYHSEYGNLANVTPEILDKHFRASIPYFSEMEQNLKQKYKDIQNLKQKDKDVNEQTQIDAMPQTQNESRKDLETGRLKKQANNKQFEKKGNPSYLVYNVCGVDFKMIKIHKGGFKMGTLGHYTYAWEENIFPRVSLSEFYLGETTVTQDLWEAVMGNNPSGFIGKKNPVEYISWYDCLDFIKALNLKTGIEFRLPTEAEWEYAARGGGPCENLKYCGSNDINTVCWYDKNSEGKPHPVKLKKPNRLGLYDMSGNVMEWCSDWCDVYKNKKVENPQGPHTGKEKICRGGSYYRGDYYCRVYDRFKSFTPDTKSCDLGFRLALSIP